MKRDMKTAKRDRNQAKRDTAGVTPSRARPSFGGDVTVSRRDNERDNRRDSDRPGSRPVPSPSRLGGDRRFDGWLAGATAEQQAAWKERQKKAGKP